MATNTFQNIVAWREAYSFVLLVYRATKEFPPEEKFGLTSQFQRAAVSIPANIAEGYKKISRADKLRFLNIAQGSLEECRVYVQLAGDLQYTSTEFCTILLDQLEKTSWYLNSYIKGIVNNAAIKD